VQYAEKIAVTAGNHAQMVIFFVGVVVMAWTIAAYVNVRDVMLRLTAVRVILLEYI
jgi:hypothetical protein